MRAWSRALATGVCAALSVLTLASAARAQGEARGRAYTKSDVDRVIRRVEERSDELRSAVDRALDRGALDGTRREDEINQQVKELENAIDRLRAEFDRTDTWRETRSRVQSVIGEADEVGAIVERRRGISRNVRAQWALVRRDLNTLADVYGLRGVR